jgi:mRNA-degrading endonuclease RelE of RelBE toxin-antitoxin system
MVFYETEIFTEQIVAVLDDDSYWELQAVLIRDPESGDLIPRTRGLRKIRWRAAGRGKRGGIRVIYYLVTSDKIYMLFAYAKTKQENLTPEQLQRLRKLVDQHLTDENL